MEKEELRFFDICNKYGVVKTTKLPEDIQQRYKDTLQQLKENDNANILHKKDS
jgi:hypothetical protein